MAFEIKMPQLSDTMHAGKILTWLKKEGENVTRGDILAEVETDKANLQIESFQQGVLLKIVIPAGSTATVGDIIAVIGNSGEAIASLSNTNGSNPQSATTNGSSPSISIPQSAPLASTQISPAPSSLGNSTQVAAATSPSMPVSNSGRVKASPLARKIAEQNNIDLACLHGSGPNGRIIRKDVENLQPKSQSATIAIQQPEIPKAAAVAQAGASYTPFSKMRDTIARRMQESVREYPHFYVTTSIEMTEALKLRATLKERADFKGISLNHLVLKAAAYGLEHEPRVNCAVRDNQVYNPGQINIGIITAIEDGLLIPVIKEANRLSLRDLVFEARAAVERARAGRPNSSDLSGGTFSISNMGMFDVENFTAIINPGQGAVLAVSSVREEPVVKNGQIVVGQRMKVTISVDHRIIDGVMAGNFLKFFKEALEMPALLCL